MPAGDGEGEHWRAVFEGSPLASLLATVDGTIVAANLALATLVGRQHDHLVGIRLAEVVHPDDEAAYEAMLAVAARSEPAVFEGQLAHASGSSLCAEVHSCVVESARGRLILAHLTDVTERNLVALGLADERRRFQQAQAMGRVGSWEWDIERDAVTWSDVMFDLYGVDKEQFRATYEGCRALLHPDDRAFSDAAWRRCADSGASFLLRQRVVRPRDGSERVFEARGQAEHGPDGPVVRLVGTAADVTEQAQAEAERARAASFQQAVLAASPDVISLHDLADGSTVWSSRPLAAELGYSAGEVAELTPGELRERLLPDGERARYDVAVQAVRALPYGEVVHLRSRARHRDGSVHWLSSRLTPFQRNPSGLVSQYLSVTRDITDMVDLEQALEHAALHDELTGLPNRRLLGDRLRHALARTDRSGSIAVLFCDLDGFKQVNDGHGHAAGDGVLSQVAARLLAAVRPGDTLGRVGGDEFLVLLEAGHGEDVRLLAEEVAVRIEQAIAEPISVGGVAHRITTSIGIALAGSGTDPDALLADADSAMYRAKVRGKNGHALFDRRGTGP